MSLDHLRPFHTYVHYDANILLSNSQLSVRRITAITEKHTDNENVLTRAQRIKQTNNHHHHHHQWPPPIPIRTHAYRHTGALTPSSRPKEEDSMTAHHRHTRRQSLAPNDRPSAAYTRTHRVEDGDTIGSSRAAQITAHSQRDDGNDDDDDDHGKGPAAIKLLFQLHPLDGRPINPNNHQRS